MSVPTDPRPTDPRTYGEAVIDQGKAALDEVRKPLLAAVGATDLAVGQIRASLRDFPAGPQQRLRALQDEALAQLRRLQERAQTGSTPVDPTQVRQAVQTYTAQARDAYGTYSAQARETYDTLTHRGELVVRRLRRSPELRHGFEEAGELLERVDGAVERAGDGIDSTQRTVTGKRPGANTAPRKPAPRSATRRPGGTPTS